MWILGPNKSIAVLAEVSPVWEGGSQEDSGRWNPTVPYTMGPSVVNHTGSVAASHDGCWSPQWILLGSSVEQSPGVHDGLSDVIYWAFQCLKRLLKSLVMRATRIFYSTSHWELWLLLPQS